MTFLTNHANQIMATVLFGVPTVTFRLLFVLRTGPRSPWQNAYAELVIGSIRRECLDHVIVVNAAGLHRILAVYVTYYMQSRHAPEKEAPIAQPIMPASLRRIVVTPHVGGLHHRYDRAAA